MNPRGRDVINPVDIGALHRRLAAARRRLAQAAPQSPEWDAAQASMDDLGGGIGRLLAADPEIQEPAPAT